MAQKFQYGHLGKAAAYDSPKDLPVDGSIKRLVGGSCLIPKNVQSGTQRVAIHQSITASDHGHVKIYNVTAIESCTSMALRHDRKKKQVFVAIQACVLFTLCPETL